MNIEFPALNYSYSNWNEIQEGIILYDLFYYRSNLDLFNKFYLNQSIIDSNGVLWKITGVKKSNNILRKLFKFLPGVNKWEMNFERINEKIDFKEVKLYYLDKVKSTFGEGTNHEWEQRINGSSNFKDLFS